MKLSQKEKMDLGVLVLFVISGGFSVWIHGGKPHNQLPVARTDIVNLIAKHWITTPLVFLSICILFSTFQKALLLEMKQDPVAQALLSQELFSEKYLFGCAADLSAITTFVGLCAISTLLRVSLPYFKEQRALLYAVIREQGVVHDVAVNANMMNDAIEINADRMRRGFNAMVMRSINTHLSPHQLCAAVDDNAQKLENIGFEGDIPDAFICPLSFNIMTHPVYDAGFPKGYRFEQSWIMEELTIRQKNPFTTTPLGLNGLVPDQKLKDEIDTFVQQTLSLHDEEIERQDGGPTFF